MRGRKLSIFLVTASALVLGACKDTDRPLEYQKGVYGGKPDTKLTSDTVRTLRERGKRVYQ